VFDENATDNTDKVKKGITTAGPWAGPEVARPKFSVFADDEVKPRRQALAPIPQHHNLEDSACSFNSVNTSLHQSDFVLQPRVHDLKNPFQIKV